MIAANITLLLQAGTTLEVVAVTLFLSLGERRAVAAHPPLVHRPALH